jgi:hypothetical protein
MTLDHGQAAQLQFNAEGRLNAMRKSAAAFRLWLRQNIKSSAYAPGREQALAEALKAFNAQFPEDPQ